MAVAVLAAAGSVPSQSVAGRCGSANSASTAGFGRCGACCRRCSRRGGSGARRVVVASGNAAEAALVAGVDVRCAAHLGDIVGWLTGDGPALEQVAGEESAAGDVDGADLADVAGQTFAKRALEIAAAGAHHLYMVGTPGAGKTMLAERLPGLLPLLDDRASMEVTAIHSVAGLLSERPHLVRRPPMQAPHHTASVAALVGGGSHLARPGAISLAHHGVLFLDEAPEFSPRALDALRQPLESGSVVLHRGGGAVRYPAHFQLVLAANPCPCGQPARNCTCPPMTRRRHEQRLSGPLIDRIDLRVQVDPVAHADLFDVAAAREPSASVAARVVAARAAAAERWRGTPYLVNASVPGSTLRDSRWALPPGVLRPVRNSAGAGFVERPRIRSGAAPGLDPGRPCRSHRPEVSGHR